MEILKVTSSVRIVVEVDADRPFPGKFTLDEFYAQSTDEALSSLREVLDRTGIRIISIATVALRAEVEKL